MAISGYPLKTKYTPGDSVYIYENGRIINVTIDAWRCEVDNPSEDGDTARQQVFYTFLDRTDIEREETYTFASENHALWYVRGDRHFNVAIESGTGGESFFGSTTSFNNKRESRGFGNWVDLAGMSFYSCTWRSAEILTNLTGTISVAAANYVVTGVGTAFQDELEVGFKIKVGGEIYEIDEIQSQTSMWLLTSSASTHTSAAFQRYQDARDKNEFQGTITMSLGSPTMTGDGTKFQDELTAGDTIIINGTETLTILSIASQTSLTTTTNAANDWSAGGYILTNYTVDKEFDFLTENESEPTLIFDACNLFGAFLPAAWDTKAEFRALVKSYDADTTIWTDNLPIGRP